MAENARGGRYHPTPEGAISPLATSYSMACWSSGQAPDPSQTPQPTHVLREDIWNVT